VHRDRKGSNPSANQSLPFLYLCDDGLRMAVGRNMLRDSGKKDSFDNTTDGICLFLRAFPKLRKATVGFVMSVCPSVRMERLGSHWKDYSWHLTSEDFSKNLSSNFKFLCFADRASQYDPSN